MPVYNEARTLRTIVGRVLSSPIGLEVELMAVDDASTDDSFAILVKLAAADSRVRVLQHPVNRGKGAAVRTAIEHMTGDAAVVQDSDLEYDPAEYPRLLKPIIEGRADAVFGSRFAASPERRVLLYWHSLGNKLLTWLTNVLNDVNLTDMETCYKAVRADILKQLRLQSERFGIEPEITTRLVQAGARIYEVPVSYHGRSYVEGKTIGWKDGMQAVWLLFKYRYLDTRFTNHDGLYTLQTLRRARRYNRWILRQFHSHLGQSVMEAGCGIGNLTEQLLDRRRLVCVDIDPAYVEVTSHRFGHLENVTVLQGDLSDPMLFDQVRPYRPDTIVCLNVLEHINDSAKVLAGFFEVLEPNGHAIVLVPAQPDLFNSVDQALGHVRRYTQQDIADELATAGFEVVSVKEVNRLGTIGWRLNGRLGRKEVSPRQARWFERLIPLVRVWDRLGLGRGLSLIAVARKPASA